MDDLQRLRRCVYQEVLYKLRTITSRSRKAKEKVVKSTIFLDLKNRCAQAAERFVLQVLILFLLPVAQMALGQNNEILCR